MQTSQSSSGATTPKIYPIYLVERINGFPLKEKSFLNTATHQTKGKKFHQHPPPPPPHLPRPMYHCGDMILRVRRSKLNAAHTSTTLRQEPLGQYQFHKKKRDYLQYILGAANITLEIQTANCYCLFFFL